MRALQFDRFGGPDVLALVERPGPVATADMAVVRVAAASINPSDVKNVAGRMAQTRPPRVPGRDYAGTVVDGPAEWLGAEVWGTGGDVGFTRDGTHAERILVPVASLCRKPARLAMDEAASIGVNFLTAWLAVVDAARVQTGETIAIIGLGGVGGAAAQIAKRRGARVVGISRSAPPADAPVHDAVDSLIVSGGDDPVTLLNEETGDGADVVFDTVGGSMFETALRMLALRGRLVEISATDRRQVSFDLADFYHQELQLLGVDSLKRDLTAATAVLDALAPGFEDGTYRPPMIAARFGLDRAAEAFRLVAAGTAGRVVLMPGS